MVFLLNPYNVDLDLSYKDTRKMFEKGSEFLGKKDQFDGKKGNYGNFVKLIEQKFGSIRMVETITVLPVWSGGRAPYLDSMINIFISNMVTK